MTKHVINFEDETSDYYDQLSNQLGLSEGGVDRLNTDGAVISTIIVPEESKQEVQRKLESQGCICLGSLRDIQGG